MANVLAFDHEHHHFSDVGGMIGEPLE